MFGECLFVGRLCLVEVPASLVRIAHSRQRLGDQLEVGPVLTADFNGLEDKIGKKAG